MATVILSLPPIAATISLALLLDVFTLSCAAQIGESETGVLEGGRIDLNGIDWIPIMDGVHEKIFAEMVSKGIVKPETVLEKLIEAKETSEASERPMLSEPEKTLVEYLIKFSQLDGELCTAEYLDGFPSGNKFSKWAPVKNYTEHYKEKLFSICQELVLKEANQYKPSKSEEQRLFYMLEKLQNEAVIKFASDYEYRCVRYFGPESFDFSKLLITALKSFLETMRPSNSGGLKESIRRKLQKLPYDLFQKHVLEPCEGWLSATERVRGIIDHIDPDKKLCINKRWLYETMDKGDICKCIKDNHDALVKILKLSKSSSASTRN